MKNNFLKKFLLPVFAIASLMFITVAATPLIRQIQDSVWCLGLGVNYNPAVSGSTDIITAKGSTGKPGGAFIDDDGGTYVRYNDTTVLVDADEGIKINGARFSQLIGDTVASAGNLVLGYDGATFPVSGTTTVNGISTTDWPEGSVINLHALGSFSITDSATVTTPYFKIYCSGGSNLSMTAGDIVTFQLRSSVWRQATAVVALVN